MLKDINTQVAAGVLSPTVDKTFPFARAADAHQYIQDRKNFGKVLLTPRVVDPSAKLRSAIEHRQRGRAAPATPVGRVSRCGRE